MGGCSKCGQEVEDSAEYCSSCEAEIASSHKPAGFWIRVGASLIDSLVGAPLIVLYFFNLVSIKSMFLLIVIPIPGAIYKPFMESFFGATLGKMACGIRVMDELGEKLTLKAAYIRFLPFLLSKITGLIGILMTFSSTEFQRASTFIEIAEMQSPIDLIETIVVLFVLLDCVVVAFTPSKCAIHDLMAGSFCVFKHRE